MSIVPPASPPTASMGAGAVPIMLMVSEPTADLLQLAPGTRFNVTVIGVERGAVATVESPYGTFSLRGGAGLAQGATLTLQMPPLGGQMQFRLIAINGQLLQPQVPGALLGSQMTAGIPPGLSTGWGEAVTPGRLMTATPGGAGAVTGLAGTPPAIGIAGIVIRGAPAAATLTSPLGTPPATTMMGQPTVPTLTTGTRLTVRIAEIQPATAAIVPTATTMVPTGQPEPPPMPRTSLAAYAMAPGSVLGGNAPPSPPSGPVVSTNPLLTPLPGNTTTAVPLVLSGTVSGSTPARQPVIHTPAGTIALDTRTEIPLGASVTLEILHQSQPEPAPSTPPPAVGPDWSVLDEAMKTLQHADPAAAQMLANAIPTLGPRLAAALLNFAGSLKLSGSGRGWPGEATLKALERSGPQGAALARKLAATAAEATTTSENSNEEWQTQTFPFQYGTSIETIRFSVHHPAPEKDEKNASEYPEGDSGTRFLVDVNLSRLGGLQLDGLLRRTDHRFNLIVRTYETLPPEMQRDITNLFTQSALAMDLTGTVTFRVAEAFIAPRNAPSGSLVSKYV